MKRNHIFIALIFIGTGIYYLVSAWFPAFAAQWFTWHTLLIWFGLALAIDGFRFKQGIALLPGLFMIGLGLHFHLTLLYPDWPSHIGMIAILFGIACLITYLKVKKDVLFIGIILVSFGFVYLFFESFVHTIREATASFAFIWPLLLIVVGGVLLFMQKRTRKRRW